MRYTYISNRIKDDYTNPKYLDRSFGRDVTLSYSRFINDVESSINLDRLRLMYKGYNIKMLQGKNRNIWAARLNIKYRVEFETLLNWAPSIEEITIMRIHAHKYN